MKDKTPRERGALRIAVIAALAIGGAAVAAVSSKALVAPGASVTVCQVTGSANAPSYAQVNVAADQAAAYPNQNPGSFAGACPASNSGGSATNGGGSGDAPSGAVTVCKVTGNASSPNAEMSIAADQVTGFLNQNAGSFVGACPSEASNSGSGSTGDTSPNGSVTVCHITGSASAPSYAQASVAVDQLAAYLNRTNSFVGTCPSPADANGNPGPLPRGFVTICKVTGSSSSPYSTLTLAANKLGAYLDQAGTITPAPAGGCPTTSAANRPGATGGSSNGAGGSGGSGGVGSFSEAGPPTTSSVGSTRTITVHTTPNTVVTARGAGVRAATKSDKRGRAAIKFKPTRPGIVTVRAAAGKVVRPVGVLASRQSGASLTG